MAHSDYFLPLYDASGNMYAVMLSAELWSRGKHKLEPIIKGILEDLEPTEKPEPMHEWDDFVAFWDFKYPLTKDVLCQHCKAYTEDWQTDSEKPFRLKSAGLGGLVVFSCTQCGATVRKKHFKDHYCFECTPKSKS